MALEPGTYVTSNVKLLRMLRKGSMGAVWLADHEALRTEVAVKVIDEALLAAQPDASGRFKREAGATAKIKSPHVVQIFDYGELDDGTQFMVMEKLEGESLAERLKAAKWLSPDETVELLRQVGNALDMSHSNDLIHRDIKPHNIFLRQVHGGLHVKVLDFGLAKSIDPDDSGAVLTNPGMVVGTVQYLSRELVLGVAKIDYRVDLWALAVVAYRCLTGELPFAGEDLRSICDAIVSGQFRRPSKLRKGLPASVDDWFARAFHTDPTARFTSADQMARSLRDALEGQAMAVFPEASRRRSRPLPRWVLYAGGGGVCAVLVALGLALLLGGEPSEEPATGPSSAAPAASAAAPAASAAVSGSASASAAAAAGEDMILIPAGPLWQGCDDQNAQDCAASEKPGRSVHIDAFFIDRTEVTVAAYQRCVAEGKCTSDQLDGYAMVQGGPFKRSDQCSFGQEQRAEHPINCITHEQAVAYCSFAGKRLPTEAEWEKAARGTDRRSYPWGEERPSCELTVMASSLPGCGEGQTWPVGKQAKDVSPFGVLDLGGNVVEWVADWYDAGYYSSAPSSNPQGPAEGPLKITRGGSFRDLSAALLRCSMRAAFSPATRNPRIGFRCARSQK